MIFNNFDKGTLISHYKIIRKIGSGGMGDVYLAQDFELNREVALKFLSIRYNTDKNFRIRFKREAQAAAAINHPNIVTIYEIGEYKDHIFIAMEYVEGRSLKKTIEGEKLSIKEIIELFISICQGLEKAHGCGIIHRDIKPSNILINSDNQPKLLDFGLAFIKGEDKLTKTHSTIGTVSYMSPEQVQDKKIDHRTDIFSLGVVLYEIITGKLPFQGEYEAAIIYSIIKGIPEPLAKYRSGVPQALQDIVSKALDKDVETRYQSIAEIAADLKRLMRDLESKEFKEEISETPKLKTRRIKSSRLLIAVAILVVILAFIFFSPINLFQFRYWGYKPIENSLAVMYFDNKSDSLDSKNYGEIISSLLTHDLSESKSLVIISRQKLYDILSVLGKKYPDKIDRFSAIDIALKAQVKYMISGTILYSGYEIILKSVLVDVVSGKIIGSQEVIGKDGDNLLNLIDLLTVEIKNDFPFPGILGEKDPKVADLTTGSINAYRHYLEGRDLYFKLYWEEAKRSFIKAIEIDSTFALAYYGLALVNLKKNNPLTKDYISRAIRYSDKVGDKERILIKSLDAVISGDYEKAISDLEESIGSYKGNAEDFIWLESEAYYWIAFFYKSKLNNLEKALEYFYKVLEVDSLHKATYNELVYTYKNLGDFEKSLWAADRQIEIAPNEANPYDTKGDLYWDHGMIDKAIECYRKALEIRPNFYDSIRKLGNMYIFSGKYNEAKKYYQQLASSPEKDRQAEGRTCLAWIPLYQGKLGEALEILDNAIAADTMESAVDIQTVNKYFIKTLIYEEKKEYTSALKEMRNFMNLLHTMYPGTKKDGRHYYIKLLAENRDFEAAVKISEEFKKDIDNNSRDMPFYWFAKASIEHSKGNFDKSIEYFEQASKLNKNWTSYYLGISYLEGGKIEKSIKEFESLLNDYSRDRLIWGIQSVKSHYYLGRCYEQLGLKEKAIDQYEKFLKIWEKADSGITEIKDATQRLSKLKG